MLISTHIIVILERSFLCFELRCNIVTFQPRPTIYNVVKEMTEMMGYTVSETV